MALSQEAILPGTGELALAGAARRAQDAPSCPHPTSGPAATSPGLASSFEPRRGEQPRSPADHRVVARGRGRGHNPAPTCAGTSLQPKLQTGAVRSFIAAGPRTPRVRFGLLRKDSYTSGDFTGGSSTLTGGSTGFCSSSCKSRS